MTRKKWLEAVRIKEAWLGKLYDKFSFQFEDLSRLDDRSLQKLIASVDEKKLFLAFKLASEDLKTRIFENMSKSRKDNFVEEMAHFPKVHKREVYKAQFFLADFAKTQLELGKFSFRIDSKSIR